MRFFSIAMMIFCMVIASSWMNQVNILGAPENYTYLDFNDTAISIESLNQSALTASENYTQPESIFTTVSQWGDFFTGLGRFVGAISDATIGVHAFLLEFGFPEWMATDLTIIIYFIYAAGTIQFIANRGFRHYR